MVQKYKEIFYGMLFGVGAAIIDSIMDARAEGLGLWDELIQHPGMLLYRILFVLLGLVFGWLLWQKNKRERDFRDLDEMLHRFRQECGGTAFVMHTKLQVLLTRQDLHLSNEAEGLIRSIYERSQDLQTLVNSKLPAEVPDNRK
jgi:hypothetical protein